MPQPTASDLHVDAILGNIATAYVQNADNFIADKVFPRVPVDKQSNKFFTFTKADWFRDEADRRGDAQESVGSGYGVGTDNYFCDVWAIHKDVGHLAKANEDAPLDWRRNATEFVMQRLLLRREIQFASDYMTTSVWATDKTGGTDFTQWSNYATSDPIEDVEAGKETILQNTGHEPNTLVLGYQVFRKLKHHPDIVDRYKHTSAESITADMIAAVLDVERVIVAKSIKNTANEGATASFSFVHGKTALLCYVAPNPGIMVPSAGYTFAWQNLNLEFGGGGSEISVFDFFMKEKKASRIEGELAIDMKPVGTDLGYFFANAVA